MKRVFAGLAFGTLLLQASLGTAFAQAREWSGVCVGGEANDVATIQGIECLMGNVLSVFFAVIGLAAFIMVVIGATRILLSGGNSKNVDTGKKTITLAIIGIVVALAGFILVRVLSGFTGVDLLQFVIPRSNEDIIGPAAGGGSGGFN